MVLGRYLGQFYLAGWILVGFGVCVCVVLSYADFGVRVPDQKVDPP